MTETQAIKESIVHWERMREWARKQRWDKGSTGFEMREAISETWAGTYCVLCNTYRCSNCPLYKKYGKCGVFCVGDNAWKKVNLSKTWGEWIVASNAMIEQLKSLLKK